MTDESFDVQSFARDINVLLVLSTLRAGPRHGYQIALDVETESNGLFRFRHGTLYPILHRLEEEGLIHGRWSRADGGRRRKEYTLTARGEGYLRGETDRVENAMARLLDIVRGPGAAPA
jgi:DNA-binding PadR family transcriptional regulator